MTGGHAFGEAGTRWSALASSRGWRGLLLDLSAGLLAALGQAPFGFWPLALGGFALVLWRVPAADTARQAFGRGLAAGVGYFGLTLSWIVQPFLIDPWTYGWMAPFALILIAFGMGLFWGAAGWLTCRIGGRAVTLAFALSAAEFLRGHVLTGFPWALPGYIWGDTLLAQMASLLGVYGMNLAMLLVLALILGGQWWRWGLAACIVAGSIAWSYHRLHLPEPSAGTEIVRIVQPNIRQSLKWDPDEAQENFDILLALTRNSPADLVVWPETAVPYLIEPEDMVARAIAAAAGDALVATGIQRSDSNRAWNSLVIIGRGGRFGQGFDKIHLVPFGEYIPMGDLIHDWTGLGAFASQAGAGYLAGDTRNLLDFGQMGKALPVICYEAIFPGELRTDERPDWIIQVTNDAWFGTLTGPYQHFAQVRFRAIELGLPVLRAANTGISAIIDARGRVASDVNGHPALLGLNMRGFIDGHVPGALSVTPYARFGDFPLGFLLIGGLALSWLKKRCQGLEVQQGAA